VRIIWCKVESLWRMLENLPHELFKKCVYGCHMMVYFCAVYKHHLSVGHIIGSQLPTVTSVVFHSRSDH
jgi:hypothetical protein